jgi:UTP--glucose-1-phosphate uridylyltransferase
MQNPNGTKGPLGFFIVKQGAIFCMKIHKALFPVAGMGTRFLPATKANPKEMMPIVDKPLIQFAVEEAIAAGMDQLIFVTSSSKRAIEDHFDSHFELELRLAEQKKYELLDIVRNILPKGISCVYIRQAEPLGLGDAVLCAKHVIGDEPFAVLLADDLIDSGETTHCLTEMIRAFTETRSSIVAVEPIDLTESPHYGMVGLASTAYRHPVLLPINRIVEKPAPCDAPSNLAVLGRYVLSPKIFSDLESLPRGVQGEVHLTDALARLLERDVLYAYPIKGKRYDCGSHLGYLQAIVAYGLRHPKVGVPFQRYLIDHIALHEELLA